MTQPKTPIAPANEPMAEHAAETSLDAASESNEGVSEDKTTQPRLDPTRYGDWELNGKCVDF